MLEMAQNFIEIRDYILTYMEGSPLALIITAVISILWGILTGFLGYRVFRVLLALLGTASGAMIGAAVCGALWGKVGTILGALACAALSALATIFLYSVAIFLFGATMGALIGYMIITATGTSIHQSVLILPTMFFGVLAVFAKRPVIIVLTSLGGSWGVVTGVFHFFAKGSMSPMLMTMKGESLNQFKEFHELMLFVWVILGVACSIVQFKTTREEAVQIHEHPPPLKATENPSGPASK